jgi:hypothetical protein
MQAVQTHPVAGQHFAPGQLPQFSCWPQEFVYGPQTCPASLQVVHVVHVPFTQAMFVPQTVPLGSGLEPQVLFAHVAVAHGLLFGQTLPQVPQFWGLVAVLVSQPSAGLLLQSAKPALQATS